MSTMRTIGLIELPAPKLVDPQGQNWTAFRKHGPLVSLPILAASLCERFDVSVINLKQGDEVVEMGGVLWRNTNLRKQAVGTDWRSLDPSRYDVWGVTNNYLQEREIACAIISHLASEGAKVVVGGSDAFAEPVPYLDAGATLVVMDKTGGSNIAAVNMALGREPDGPYLVRSKTGMLRSGSPRTHPDDWRLPPVAVAAQALGTHYWEGKIPERLLSIGSAVLDHGCDRHCDFCETPTYKLGYQYMSVARSLEWVALQKEAGAKSFISCSDQFLGRVLWETGRQETIDILNGFRELRMPVLWGNGLELSKATLGRGRKNGDPRPDYNLIQALWGWDGTVGCGQAYVPAERPLDGSKNYAKLLDWKNHVELLKAIVSSGLPDLTYGVIVGLPEDNRESLARLLDAIQRLKTKLKRLNPALIFRVTPFAIRPIPGTSMAAELQSSGMLRFTDPAILGGFWTACADTLHLSYEDVSDWQKRIMTECSDDWAAWGDFRFTN